MSMQPMNAERYEFDAADRIRRAMRVADVGVTELAKALDVNRNTVGNWINGHTIPRRRDLMAIAMRTGFPLAWLETGEAPHDGGTSPGGGLLPGLDSNQEPAG
ncbi:helix-turn-helix transcriptional regulator [Microbacterium sp. LMI11-1-1.1]|uniref:helix-turn-helix domain-containing protein n=2 Tax=Microbacterium TaxID=33882 RepID=UPI0034666B31